MHIAMLNSSMLPFDDILNDADNPHLEVHCAFIDIKMANLSRQWSFVVLAYVNKIAINKL